MVCIRSETRRQLLVADGLGGRGQLSDQLLQSSYHPHHAALVEVALVPRGQKSSAAAVFKPPEGKLGCGPYGFVAN